MNSPSRFASTRRIAGPYNGSYNAFPFIPKRKEMVGDFECVIVMPEHGSFLYRMDERKPFAFDKEKGDVVFGTKKNSYFGIQPSNIMNAYKKHSFLYVAKAHETPIVLIDMGNLKNIHRLLAEPTPEEIRHSVSIAFPIKEDGKVHRYSVPGRNHNDKIDHDRRVLEYLCTLGGIDGYYVSVDGLHPEIGLCRASLGKLEVVDMFKIRPEILEPVRPEPEKRGNRGTKRNLSPNIFSPNGFPSLRRRIRLNENENGNISSAKPPSFASRLNFAGGGRRRHTNKTQRKHRK